MLTVWDNFFVAEVGASASLAGLIFVGVSINISKIVSIARLPGRAIQALVALLSVLVVSLLFLVPDQTVIAVGIEILVVGVVAWTVNTQFDIKNYRMTEKKYQSSYVSIAVLDQASLIPYVVAGVVTLFLGQVGIYWLVPATIISFVKAMTDAWVLLVEINR